MPAHFQYEARIADALEKIAAALTKEKAAPVKERPEKCDCRDCKNPSNAYPFDWMSR